MSEEATKRQLAEEAVNLLEEAEKLEADKQFERALYTYQQAADRLQKSGYASHNFEEIFTKITTLNQRVTLAQKADRLATKQHVAALQQQAFAIMDDASKLKTTGKYQEAIELYHQATAQLTEAGWTPDQLNSIQTEIVNLQRSQALVEQSKVPALLPEELADLNRIREITSHPSSEGGEATNGQLLQEEEDSTVSSSTAFAKSVAQFEERRRQNQKQVDQAFTLIDEADKMVQQENWEAAINNYNLAIDIFNKTGWQGQTHHLYTAVARLQEEKVKVEQARFLATTPESAERTGLSDSDADEDLEGENEDNTHQIEAVFAARRENVQLFESRKEAERETQESAFEIIQEAQSLADKQQFKDAADKYIQAISMLNSIGWQQQTAQLQVILGQLQDRQQQIEKQHHKALQKERARKREIAALEEQIQDQVAAEQEAIQQRRITALEREEHQRKVDEVKNTAFALIDEGEQARKAREPDFENAIAKYEEARQLLERIHWQDQADHLREAIATIMQEQEEWVTAAHLAQARQEEEVSRRAASEEMIRQRMEEDARSRETQQKILQKFVAKQKRKEETQEHAISLLDEANTLRGSHKYDHAIETYRQVSKLFEKLGWNQQRVDIEKEILDTQNEAQDWQQGLETQRRAREAKKQKQLAKEAKIRQEDEAQRQMSLELKSMIKKVAMEQERKQQGEKVERKQSYQKNLTKKKADAKKNQGIQLLREELRHKLADEEATTVIEKEQDVKKRIKQETDIIKRMIHKANTQDDEEGGT